MQKRSLYKQVTFQSKARLGDTVNQEETLFFWYYYQVSSNVKEELAYGWSCA